MKELKLIMTDIICNDLLLTTIQGKVCHLPARNSSLNPPLICSVDGNIGSGKSTVLGELKQKGYFVFEEDLTNWGSLLENFYANPKRWSCSLQIKILHSMRAQYEKMCSFDIKITKQPFVFVERSPLSSMLFVNNSINNGFLNFDEIELIQQVYRDIFWCPDISFYLNTSVDECFKRKNKRDRKCETNVSKQYLENLHNGYIDLYSQKLNAYIINGQATTCEIANEILQCLK